MRASPLGIPRRFACHVAAGGFRVVISTGATVLSRAALQTQNRAVPSRPPPPRAAPRTPAPPPPPTAHTPACPEPPGCTASAPPPACSGTTSPAESGSLVPAPYRPGPALSPQIPLPAAADQSPATPDRVASIGSCPRHGVLHPQVRRIAANFRSSSFRSTLPQSRPFCSLIPVPSFPVFPLHRTHSNCLSRTPFAAADSGSNASFTSTHAHARSSAVRCATNFSARLVRPDDAAPVSSLIAPTGSPPCTVRPPPQFPSPQPRALCAAQASAPPETCVPARAQSQNEVRRQ